MGGRKVLACVLALCGAWGGQAMADDRGIEQNLRQIIMKDPMLRRSRSINIKAEEGVVYLWGKADSLFDKMQAGLYAEQLEGVSEVHNCIKVQYRWPWEDEECGCCHEPFIDR